MSSAEAKAQLSKWKDEKTKLFLHWSASTAHGWCVGFLRNAGSELLFEAEGVDGVDCLFVVNAHETYHPRFRFLDINEGLPFFAPRRERSQFGTVLEIALEVDRNGESKGRVVFAEIFPDQAIELGSPIDV